MATRSIIGKCESNGSIVAIYCHWKRNWFQAGF